MKKILLLLFFPIFLFINNCKIGDDTSTVVRDVYSFQEKFKLSDIKKEYSVGDLVWMEYNRSGNTYTDVTTGEEIVVGNPTMYTDLLLSDPFNDPNNSEKFGSIFQEGEFDDADDFNETGKLNIKFGCPISTNPRFKLGIQLKATGAYLLHPNPGEPFIQFPFTTETNCISFTVTNLPDEADFGFVEFFFDMEDTNLDKFEEYVLTQPTGEVDIPGIRTLLEEKRAYFIWVK